VLCLQQGSLAQRLVEQGQGHLFQPWSLPETRLEDKQKLMEQLTHFDKNYAGGLIKYIENAKILLEESRKGSNPLEGFTPEVPEGISLDFGGTAFQDMEIKGIEQAEQCAFVLVAGGLGERLGYSGIKVALPVDLSSNMCFLQLYIESILSLQQKARKKNPTRKLPLAIMTSGDTHDRTEKLLHDNQYFGMDEDQVVLMKQEKVACLSDSNATLAMEDDFSIQTKPHGHGDVHMLLHHLGIAEKWRQDGFKWLCFFQDTNGQVFTSLLSAIGVSATHDYDVNSLAVPRKAKEAIGAITRLKGQDGTTMTINVEYNQLDPLLRATTHPEGDVNDVKTGFSPFPGNINQLILKLDTYCQELERHKGVIAEFVNPKYADESRTAFKKSTRLECMMQDFPKSLPSNARVGFTTINQVYAAYSPVKNNAEEAAVKAAAGNPPHSATSGELDRYRTNCEMLQMIGCTVDTPDSTVSFNNIDNLTLWPRVSWSPLFALTIQDLKERIHGQAVHIGKDTSMYIQAPNVSIQKLNLEHGRFEIKGDDTPIEVVGRFTTKDGTTIDTIDNQGWEWVALDKTHREQAPEELAIRGFMVQKKQQAGYDALKGWYSN
jgi:UDP-sugar pyrophosphorylase